MTFSDEHCVVSTRIFSVIPKSKDIRGFKVLKEKKYRRGTPRLYIFYSTDVN